MPNFIELTTIKGESIWVSIDHIVWILPKYDATGKFTYTNVQLGDVTERSGTYTQVKETPTDILHRIRELFIDEHPHLPEVTTTSH